MRKRKAAPARKSLGARQRPLHRRISLHPISILFLLCTGVLMLAASFKAHGASTQLSMNITATPLVSPAIISTPKDNDRYNTPDIQVSGTCPSDSYVKIYKNGGFNGVAPCENSQFEFMVTLSEGANVLSVKVFNFSDQEGPASGSITVHYDVSASDSPALGPPTAASSRQKPLQPADQLRILTDYKYKVHKSGQPIKLDLALAGGSAPYAVAAYWNDGKITPISRSDTSAFIAEHTYARKPRMYTYVIKVAASDQVGNSDYIQLMAVVDGEKPADNAGTTTTVPPDGNTKAWIQTMLKYLWPAYLIVVLMVLCFYLGEREERRILLRKNQKTMFR